MILLFLSAFAVGLSGAMMPGSLLTYTIRKALASGPRAGFIITAGHAVLELCLVILIFLGFGKVLKSEPAQIIIGFAGGLMLAFMGVSMIVNAVKDRLAVKTQGGSNTGGMVLSGIVISATNPYFLLWWAVVGLGFIMKSYDSFGIPGVAVYYFGHISADFLWYGAVSVIVGKTKQFIKERPYRVIIGMLGLVLVFFGVKFFASAAAGIIK